jgi:hypothetical protein
MKRTITVCDNCSDIIDEGKTNVIKIDQHGSRALIVADLCDTCVGGFGFIGLARSRRKPGRKPLTAH